MTDGDSFCRQTELKENIQVWSPILIVLTKICSRTGQEKGVRKDGPGSDTPGVPTRTPDPHLVEGVSVEDS